MSDRSRLILFLGLSSDVSIYGSTFIGNILNVRRILEKEKLVHGAEPRTCVLQAVSKIYRSTSPLVSSIHPSSSIRVTNFSTCPASAHHISPHCTITTSVVGRSKITLTPSTILTTSMPSTTLPNATYWPSKNGASLLVIKN